jgi:DNA (cytosine-5)-methyltransferase 1
VSIEGAGPTTKLRVLDLFAGAGGLSEGLRHSGYFETVQAVEMDPEAAATYSLNHPEADIYVGPIEDWLQTATMPAIDVIIGGPPCQGFSQLGKQDVEDERNALWREYAHTIVVTEPAYFVVENVAAFLQSPQFKQFESEFSDGGSLHDYAFQAAVLNAADYGAPQARRRAVLIGHRRDLPFPGWPVKTHVSCHRSVEDAFRDIVAQPKRDLPERRITVGGRDYAGPFRTSELHVGRNYSDLSLQRFACIPAGGNRFDIDERLLAPCWKKHRSGSGDVMGRLYWDRPSVTIRTEFFKPEKGRYLHPEEHRAITHLEAAVLQGFPLDYQWVGSRLSIARQIGNAVPIPLGKAIGQRIGKSAAALLTTPGT